MSEEVISLGWSDLGAGKYRLVDVREAEELTVDPALAGASHLPLSEWASRWEKEFPDSGEALAFY